MERFAPVLKLSPSGRPWRPFFLPDPVPGSPWRPSPAPRRQISKNDNNNSVQSPLNAIIGSPPSAGPPPVPVPVPSSPGSPSGRSRLPGGRPPGQDPPGVLPSVPGKVPRFVAGFVLNSRNAGGAAALPSFPGALLPCCRISPVRSCHISPDPLPYLPI